MAKIPIYHSKGVPFRGAVKMTQAISEAGQTIAAFGEKINKSRQEEEISRAQIAGIEKSNQIMLDATQDTDVVGWDSKYEKRFGGIRRELEGMFKNKEAQTMFFRRFDLDMENYQFKVKQIGYKKLVDQRLATFDEEIAQVRNAYYEEANPDIKQQHLNKLGFLFNKAWEKEGFMSKADAENNLAKMRAELPAGQANWDILIDPEMALEELHKRNKGKYAGLPQNKRVELIKSAEARIIKLEKQQKQEEAEAINVRENEITVLQVNEDPTLTEGFIRTELDMERISPKFAKSAIKEIRSSKTFNPTALESITKFNELVERSADIAKREKAWFGDRVSFEEATNFRADTIEAKADGFISQKQMGDLLSETSKSFYKDPIFQDTLDQLAAQSELYGTPEMQARAKAEMYGNLIEKVIGGKSPNEAVNEVIREKLTNELNAAMEIEGLQEFNTMEELEAANLPKGTIILFKGERAEIE